MFEPAAYVPDFQREYCLDFEIELYFVYLTRNPDRNTPEEKEGSDMETAWYFRLFFVQVSVFIISWLLYWILRAKRMSGPGPDKKWMIAYFASLIVGLVLMWFVTF